MTLVCYSNALSSVSLNDLTQDIIPVDDAVNFVFP